MGSFVPNTPSQQEEMLQKLGCAGWKDLYRDVPREVLLEDGLGGQALAVGIADGCGYREVERLGQLGRFGTADHDGEQVLGLDAGIVEAVCRGDGGAEVLQVGDFLVALAAGQEDGCESQHAACLARKFQWIN